MALALVHRSPQETCSRCDPAVVFVIVRSRIALVGLGGEERRSFGSLDQALPNAQTFSPFSNYLFRLLHIGQHPDIRDRTPYSDLKGPSCSLVALSSSALCLFSSFSISIKVK